MILYRADSRTGLNDLKFTLSAGTYCIYYFNAKVKAEVSQQVQDGEALQIKDLKLIIPKHCTFMASNRLFIALGILDNYLEKSTRNKSTPGILAHTKHYLKH